MIDFPHNFSKFITANRPASLIIGAGVSHGLVPLPWELIRDKKDTVEKKLNSKYACRPVHVDTNKNDALYVWSEGILKQLVELEPTKAKLILAQELGLTSDHRWMAKVDVELRGSSARHRVIARFAKEGLWHSIWSLNWDTILESAFECVGLKRGLGPKTQPWPTLYSINLLIDDFSKTSDKHIVTINKPHGCVFSLLEAEKEFDSGNQNKAKEISNRLIIGKTELSVVRDNPHDGAFLNLLKSDLVIAPLTAVGWSASEKSLRRAFKSAVEPRSNSDELEELSIIDPFFNDDGHQELIDCYGLSKDKVHFEVEIEDDGFTVDKLFLWLQARYVINQLSDRAPLPWKEKVDEQLLGLNNGNQTKLIIDFADYYLPTWVRLCWRTGILKCPDFNSDKLHLDLKDEHIPINKDIETERHELRAAAGLLAKLVEDEIEWDLAGLQGEFQGGLWDEKTGHLVIPLPIWDDPSLFNDLRALTPLFKGMQRHAAFIQEISILPLSNSPTGVINEEYIEQLKNKMANESRISKFSDPSVWGTKESLMCHSGEAA